MLKFLINAKSVEADGKIDDAIDIIYDGIDNLLHNKQFKECNSILEKINVDVDSLDIILSLLTATLPVRSKLPARKKLLEDVETKLSNSGQYGILDGL